MTTRPHDRGGQPTIPGRSVAPTFRSTALVVVAFGVAMGYLEAAVVVYLRSAIESGAATAAMDPATTGTFETLEIAREIATLAMIAAVGWLAGRTGLERLAWSAVVFGTWDLVYYAGLRLAIGWPETLDAWDLLFLIPVPWFGPVWAPILVSTALVLYGLVAARRVRSGLPVEVRWVHVAAALAGAALVILSFLIDSSRVLAGDESAWSGWPLFLAGMGLAAAATVAPLRSVNPDRRRRCPT
ncbi:MAG TPA: hypothetical protein VFO78_13310 [Candidatus Limnocylindrales bacterium]|nr:hypothetical protein [Candidatus Limnocylindrales bacterium]